MERQSEQVLPKIRSQCSNLSPAEQKVYDYLMNNALADTFLSVTDLAKKADVSEATIVRFCKKVGYSGFLEFKKAFLQERLEERTNTSPYSRITPEDGSEIVLNKVFAIHQDSLGTALAQIDGASFERAVDWLASAELIEMYAHGGSGHVAQNAATQYLRQGLRCVVYTDPLVHTVAIEQTSHNDVVLGISHTGETPSVVRAIEQGRKRGLKTLAITNYPQSPLASSAEVVLLTATNSPILLSDAGVSRMCQIAILDALGVAVSLRKQK